MSGALATEVRTWSKGSARGSGPQQQRAAVRVLRFGLIACEDCGGLRVNLGGPHASHFGDDWQLVDCVGRAVSPR